MATILMIFPAQISSPPNQVGGRGERCNTISYELCAIAACVYYRHIATAVRPFQEDHVVDHKGH